VVEHKELKVPPAQWVFRDYKDTKVSKVSMDQPVHKVLKVVQDQVLKD
jgi:hypothetical protein